jgi:hypothetical protein
MSNLRSNRSECSITWPVSRLRSSRQYRAITNSSAGSITSLTGFVDAFSANMTCVPGSTLNSSVTADEDFWYVLVDVTDGSCATGLVTLTDVERNNYGDETTQTQALAVGKAILQQCSNTVQPTLFVVFAQAKATADEVFGNETVETTTDWTVASFSIDTTVIVCTPSYKVQKALVTTTPQGAFLGDIETKSESRNLSMSGWDLWSAVNHSLLSAGPAFLEGPIAHDLRIGGFLYDELFGVMISTWSRAPTEYLDPNTLINDTQRLFKAVAAQIAERYLRENSSNNATGAYRATQSRIVLPLTSLRVLEGGLTLIILYAFLMVAYSPWVLCSGAGDNTAILAVVLTRSDRLRTFLKGSSIRAHDHTLQRLSKQNFACMDHYPAGTDLLQVYSSSSTHEFDTPTGDNSFWIPPALSARMKVVTLMIPLAVIASLEVTYRISHRQDDYGLAAVPSDHRWHYTWTWTPALIMTIVKLLCQSVTSSIALLDPYSRLRKQTPISGRTLGRNNLSKTSLQLCCESLKSRRWALLATAFSALLGPFLTIVVSGLFFFQSGGLGLDATFHLADHVANPSGRYC